jgi:hypothetical protein
MRCFPDRDFQSKNGDSMTDKPQDRKPQGENERQDDKLPENSKRALDRKLDEGVEETFPASDPVSVKITK